MRLATRTLQVSSDKRPGRFQSRVSGCGVRALSHTSRSGSAPVSEFSQRWGLAQELMMGPKETLRLMVLIGGGGHPASDLMMGQMLAS